MSFMPVTRVVVPLDFSGESEQALDVALELAGGPGNVHVIHVMTELHPGTPGAVFGDMDDLTRAAAVKEALQKQLVEHDAVGVTLAVRVGNPGLEVADYAEEVGATLIVIPSHGYHGVKRLVLGSTAERVIRHAHCAVLVLRRTDAD